MDHWQPGMAISLLRLKKILNLLSWKIYNKTCEEISFWCLWNKMIYILYWDLNTFIISWSHYLLLLGSWFYKHHVSLFLVTEPGFAGIIALMKLTLSTLWVNTVFFFTQEVTVHKKNFYYFLHVLLSYWTSVKRV